MAFIYEVNGQRVEFEKEPTEKDIDEAARALAPAPESRQPKPVEGSGGAAFGVYRPQGRRPESQQGREASKDMPLQTARGVVTGTLGAIPDLLNLPGAIYGGVTGQEAPYKVPLGSDEWNQMLPFQSDTPQARLARFGGEVLAPIPTIKGVKAIAGAPGQVYRSGQEFTQGAMEGLRNPTYQRNSQTAFAPLEQTYYPTPQVQAFQNAPVASRPGMLSQLEASQQPSSSLFNSPTELLATALGPRTAQGQNLIPYQGQTTKAFGETVGRDIATEPYKRAGLPSLAGATLGGIFGGPLGAVAGLGAGAALNPLIRGAELYALNKLGKTAGFLPGFPEQLAEAQKLAGRTGLEASIPQTPLLPAPGPVKPTINMPGPQRNVNIEGQSYTLPNQIDVANSQTARPQPVAQTPAQQSQQLAAQKLQEVQQAPKVLSPQQQAIMDQIRARGAKPGVMTSTPPVAGPVNPSSIEASIDALPSDRFSDAEKLALKRAELQNNPPPAMTAADEADMAKQAIESQKATNSEIISQHARGNIMTDTTSIDTGKDAYNGSNATQGKAKALEKAGVDSLPVVNGMTDAQVIEALHTEMFGKKTKSPFTPEARTSKTVSNEIKTIDEQMTANNLMFDKIKTTVKNKLSPANDAAEFKPNSDYKITRVNDNKTVMYGTELSTGKPIKLEVDSSANSNNKKALVKVYDVTDIKNPVELANYNSSGKKVNVLDNNLFTEKKAPKNVSKMVVGEPKATGPLEQSLVSKRSFNGDLQKYRYGTEKSPLTLEEYNHLKNSEFIDKQNTRDILMGMRPDLTEYSIWYKDKSGKIQNIQTYGNEFKKK